MGATFNVRTDFSESCLFTRTRGARYQSAQRTSLIRGQLVFVTCSAAAASAKAAKAAAAAAAAKAAKAVAAATGSQTRVCMFLAPFAGTVAILAQGTPSWPMRLRRPFAFAREFEPPRVLAVCLCKKGPIVTQTGPHQRSHAYHSGSLSHH